MYLPHWPIPSTIFNKNINYETVFERMSIALDRLGNPEKKLKNIIHVAGTNGKGSSVAILSEIFKQAGFKVHSYTSPHLHDCNERIVLNGQKISDAFLFEVLEEVRIASENVDLSFAESFTIGAFLAFSKVESDVIILECLMGGRIDATNIFEHKLATLITPISFDHSEYLGEKIEQIALEKALIIRPNTPLISSSQSFEAKNIIKILADDQKIKSYFYDEDFEILFDEESEEFDLRFGDKIIENIPKPSLQGEHQYINFASAIALVLAINDKFNISDETIKNAVKNVYWPSRIEKINGFSNLTNCDIFIDGAHNSSGAFALAKWIFQTTKNYQKTYVIVGFSKNKCKKEFLLNFKNIAQLIAVKVEGEPYPENPEIICKIGSECGLEIEQTENILEAINFVKKQKGEKVRIVICGSLHLARDVKKYR